MKSLYVGNFLSSYWCQDRKLIYHIIHDLDVDNEEMEKVQDKLSEIYLHLKTNGIKFFQIYQPTDSVTLKITHMLMLTKFAHFLKSQDDIINEYCKGVSFIHGNSYVIKTVNYFIKMFENKIPVKVVKNQEMAYEFLNLKK